MTKRITARAYAAQIGVHEETLTRWCRNAEAGYPNKRLPKLACRKRGHNWSIDPVATERLQAMASGNPVEQDLARHGNFLH